MDIAKTYRIDVITQDKFLSVQEADGTCHPQVYHWVHYVRDNRELAISRARQHVKELRGVKYIRTEIKEFDFVRDIPLDF